MSLDPVLAEDGVSLQILNNTWDGLVGYNFEGVLENRLAESYTVSSDGKTYEFRLRSEARWSDGQRVRNQDFISAFRRALSPRSLCKLAPLFMSIRGAQSYHENRKPWETVGITEKNGKLIFELAHRTPTFIHTLSLPPAMPIRQEILDAHQGRWPDNAPTTGAYSLVAHELDRKLVLQAQAYYWGRRSPRNIPRIEFYVIVDESTALHLFEAGQLDVLTRVPSLDFSRLKKLGRIYTNSFLATYYLSFNCKKAPFNDRNWRRAIAGSIRKDEISQVLGAGESPARSWIPRGLDGFIPSGDQERNIDFLSSMKWVKARSSLSLPIIAGFDSGARNTKIMEKVQQDVQKNLGIQLSLMNLDWRSYGKKLQIDPPSIFRYGWLSAIMDPISHLKVFRTGDPNNYSGWSSFRYDELVNEVERMLPGPLRSEKIRLAQRILVNDEAAVIPLYHYVQNTAVSARLKGFRVSPFGVIRFQDLSID